MHFLLSFMLCSALWSATIPGNLTWATIQTVFSGADLETDSPQIAIHPSSQSASILWITSGASSVVRESSFQGPGWSMPASLSTSVARQSSLRIATDAQGTHVAIWNLQQAPYAWIRYSQNSGNGWSSPSILFDAATPDEDLNLHLVPIDLSKFVISWQDTSHQISAVTCLNGTPGSSYKLSDPSLTVSSSVIDGLKLAFLSSTSGSFYPFYTTLNPDTPSPTPTSSPLFQRAVEGSGLAIAYHPSTDPTADVTVFLFQDKESDFVISGFYHPSKPTPLTYATITTKALPVVNSKLAISPINDLPGAIWQLSDGTVKGALFDGARWNVTQLSSHGRSPQIAFNATNNHAITIWTEVTEEGEAIFMSEFDRSQWSAPASLSDLGVEVGNSDLKVNQKGYAFATWSRQTASDVAPILEAIAGTSED